MKNYYVAMPHGDRGVTLIDASTIDEAIGEIVSSYDWTHQHETLAEAMAAADAMIEEWSALDLAMFELEHGKINSY